MFEVGDRVQVYGSGPVLVVLKVKGEQCILSDGSFIHQAALKRAE